jgi:hypothetical protein
VSDSYNDTRFFKNCNSLSISFIQYQLSILCALASSEDHLLSITAVTNDCVPFALVYAFRTTETAKG